MANTVSTPSGDCWYILVKQSNTSDKLQRHTRLSMTKSVLTTKTRWFQGFEILESIILNIENLDFENIEICILKILNFIVNNIEY